jgi:pantothenate synthetase
LALSSRNVRLSPAERRAAVVLSRALAAGRSLLEQGVDYSSTVSEAMRRAVEGEPLVHLDYAVAVGAHDLVAREVIADPAAVRLLIAAEVGPVRLIDNCAGAVVAQATPGATGLSRGRVGTSADAGSARAESAEDRQLERIG